MKVTVTGTIDNTPVNTKEQKEMQVDKDPSGLPSFPVATCAYGAAASLPSTELVLNDALVMARGPGVLQGGAPSGANVAFSGSVDNADGTASVRVELRQNGVPAVDLAVVSAGGTGSFSGSFTAQGDKLRVLTA